MVMSWIFRGWMARWNSVGITAAVATLTFKRVGTVPSACALTQSDKSSVEGRHGYSHKSQQQSSIRYWYTWHAHALDHSAFALAVLEFWFHRMFCNVST